MEPESRRTRRINQDSCCPQYCWERRNRPMKYTQYLMIFCLSVLLGGCSGLSETHRNFQVCLTGETDKSQCKKLLDITVKKRPWEGNTPEDGRYYRWDVDEYWTVVAPGDARIPDYDWSGGIKVVVSIHPETPNQNFARWLRTYVGSNKGCIVNRAVGVMWAISQTCEDQGKKYEYPSSTNYVPIQANTQQFQTCIKVFSDSSISPFSPELKTLEDNAACGAPLAWFNCAEPNGTIAQQPLTEKGCSVEAQLRPGIHIKYPIYYRHLQDWQSIHQAVLNQLNTVITIKETGAHHEQPE